MDNDDHWSFKPAPLGAAINVVLDRSGDKAVVWVFDPYDANDGVFSATIMNENQIEEIIFLIQKRVEKAAATKPKII